MSTHSRSSAAHAIILSLIPAAILLLYAWNPVWRIFSDHGFLHQSIVYRLMSGEFPPDSPIFAGQDLLYLWGHHYLVAGLAHATNLPLSWLFALLNLLAVSAALFFAYLFGRRLRGNAFDGLLAALLAVVSCNLLTRGPQVELLSTSLDLIHFPYRLWQYTALVVAKYYNLNSNGLGITAVLGWLLASSIWLQHERRHWGAIAGIGVAALAVGFLYPVYTINITAAAATLFGLSLFKFGRLSRARTFLLAAATAVGLAISVPYILSVSAGRATPAITLSELNWTIHKALILALAAAIPTMLVLCFRGSYAQLFRAKTSTVILLLVFAAFSAFFWLILSQSGNEYKHLLISTVALGLLAAPGMTSLFERKKLLGAALLALLMLPFASDWLDLMNTQRWPAYHRVVERGATLHHADASEDRLYAWVRSNTSSDDVFIDDQLVIPVLGQRALYVGLDRQTAAREAEAARIGTEIADGWEWRPQDLLLQQGYAPAAISAREKLSNDFLTTGTSKLPFAKEVSGSIFLVARSTKLRETLARQAAGTKVFSNPAADIYLVRPRP